jgi:hypothetical protein
MKRNALALSLTLSLLLSAIVGTQFVNVGLANFFIPKGTWGTEPVPPLIDVQSPSEKQNFSFASDVWLKFTAVKPATSWYTSSNSSFAHTFGTISSISYSLDGEREKGVAGCESKDEYGILYFSLNLGKLQEGWHRVSIAAQGWGFYGTVMEDIYEGSEYKMSALPFKLVNSSVRVNFTVGNVIPPSVQILSPESKQYAVHDVPLSCIIDERPLFKIAYSLDEKYNVTITGNMTLIGLSNGAHNVTIYVWDVAGNIGASETLHFSIAKPEPKPHSPEPFPITLIVALLASVAIIGAGILVYFKRRNH